MSFNELFNLLLSGEGIVFILILWLFLETVILFLINRSFILGKFGTGERKISKQVHEYSSRALNLTAITFAAISFIIAGIGLRIPNIEDSLIIFVFGFFCFILSYKIGVFGATKRIYWSIQQRLLNFGLLSLVFGLLLFFNNQFPRANVLIGSMTAIVVLFHIKEYKSDYNNCVKIKKKKS